MIEIVAPGGFYDYAAKYQKGHTQYLCPAPVPAAVTTRLKALALDTYRAIGCEGAARVDFRVTPRGKPFVWKINTTPGMTQRPVCCRWRRHRPGWIMTRSRNGFWNRRSIGHRR